MHALPTNIWAFQWCGNSPPVAPHLHNHTHAHRTPNTPSHTQTFSWALHAASQLKPPLPFHVPEDSRSSGVNIGLLTMTILHLLKDAESPVCNCWGLLLRSSNWSNSGVGCCHFTLTADATGIKPWATQSLQTWLLNYILFAFQPQVLVHNTLPLVMACSSGAPTHHRARQFSRTPRERNASQYKTTFLLPWKSCPNKYFVSWFAMEVESIRQDLRMMLHARYLQCISFHPSDFYVATISSSQRSCPQILEMFGLDCTFITLIDF